MTESHLEAAIRAIDGDTLEQLAADLLSREGYSVDPTGTKGPDAGRDSLLEADGENGILHCSRQEDWPEKAKDDADKAADRDRDFEFFFFATNRDPAGIKRDRVEREITEEHGFDSTILDFSRIRGRLMGNPENHDLAREHLDVDPSHAFDSASDDADDLYEERLEQLQQRNAPYGYIEDDDLALVTVHVIPASSTQPSHGRIAQDLPEPPRFAARGGHSDTYGEQIITAKGPDHADGTFSYYSCFHSDGWVEGGTVYMDAKSDPPRLRAAIDPFVVKYVEDVIEMFVEEGIRPPYFVYTTIIGAADYLMDPPRRCWDIDYARPINNSVYRLKRVTIEDTDADIPAELRKPLYQLWNRTGWDGGSVHYEESRNAETGETEYEFNPHTGGVPELDRWNND